MNRWPLLLVAVLIGALAVLATLQSRWITEFNRAQEQRLRAELEGAAGRFTEEIDREVMRIMSSFEVRTPDMEAITRRFNAWRESARDPKLIAAFRLDEHPLSPPGFDPEHLEMTLPIRDERKPPSTFLVIRLDADALTQHLIPDSARRFFATENKDGFDVAVARGSAIVYRSNRNWPASVESAGADLQWPILMATRRRSEERRPRTEASSPWQLLVRHHGEPMSAMFAATRHRDLAIAFAILLLLGASAVVLAAAARRAERLRRQQLEFVAGITHELNTPLAALASAGQNLADELPVDTARYGATIVKETQRLIDLVDQVLQFSGMESKASRPRDTIVETRAAIDDAIAQCGLLAEEGEVRVESSADDSLPDVCGDRAAITRAVQNLVANAIRHGGAGGWVGVRAGVDDGFVAITVEDRGTGIAAADLPHLFEAFYRGRNAQTRGSGIGLTIVDRVARSHGGSITAANKRDGGAAFTLRLPSARSNP